MGMAGIQFGRNSTKDVFSRRVQKKVDTIKCSKSTDQKTLALLLIKQRLGLGLVIRGTNDWKDLKCKSFMFRKARFPKMMLYEVFHWTTRRCMIREGIPKCMSYLQQEE
jgi:hypothetical protein